MSSVKVLFEIGHESVLKSKPTAEGFTHDWELFVKSCDSHDISHFIDKVVFNLHESFTKPKRVVKEPPYILKESGYAGFVVMIDIHVRNRDEPKKISFSYDLDLQNSGPPINRTQTFSYTFANPSDDFRRKLMKGGGVGVFSSGMNFDDKSRDRLQGSNGDVGGGSGKKHKPRVENDPKINSEFANLFGTPITKPPASSSSNLKVSPDPKGHRKSPNRVGAKVTAQQLVTNTGKVEGKEKGAQSSSKESKGEKSSKYSSPPKNWRNSGSPKNWRTSSPAEETTTSSSSSKKKDRNRSKERSTGSGKGESNKEKNQKQRSSPKYNSPSNNNNNNNSSNLNNNNAKGRPASPVSRSVDYPKASSTSSKSSSSDSKKSKKEKKDKTHDRERGERESSSKKDRDSKKDSKATVETPPKGASGKDTPASTSSTASSTTQNKSNAFAKENFIKEDKPASKKEDKLTKSHDQKESSVSKDAQGDQQRRHKHKKKDKNKKEEPKEQPVPPIVPKETTNPVKDSKKKDKAEKLATNSTPAVNSPSTKVTAATTAEVPKADQQKDYINSKALSSESEPERDENVEEETTGKGQKKKHEKTGSSGEKRKRRSKEDQLALDQGNSNSPNKMEPPLKIPRRQAAAADDGFYAKNGTEANTDASSGGSVTGGTPNSGETNTISGVGGGGGKDSGGGGGLGGVLSMDYMSELRDLQQKIMTLQDNTDLQHVVEMIAATGQYEITNKTFDFDLCALDKSTVRRLQDFFATS